MASFPGTTGDDKSFSSIGPGGSLGDGSANDTFDGRGGNDVLQGYGGADYIEGGAGNDILWGYQDPARPASGQSDDADLLYGNEGRDSLYGHIGNDTLDGGAGADTMEGGADDDTYFVDDTGDAVVETAFGFNNDTVNSRITYTLTENVENLELTGSQAIDGTGNDDDNRITGNSSSNKLSGGFGEDILDGGAGSDTMEGGADNDTYVVDDGGDVVIEAGGGGVDIVNSSITHTLAENVENLELTGSEAIDGTGNASINAIDGNSANNTLSGGDSGDTLNGRGGNDTLDGGSGADTMEGGADDDTYVVDDNGDVVTEADGAGNDIVKASITHTLAENVENLDLTGSEAIDGTGNAGRNEISGNFANNGLTGGGGGDTLKGRGGNDTLDGGSGADIMEGGDDDDTYVVDDNGDEVTEADGAGNDTVQANITHELAANVERLILLGAASIDGTGNGRANEITGNSANNRIDGGAGADAMNGGAGDDTYLVDDEGDTVGEAEGEGEDTVRASASHTLDANVDHLVLVGSSSIDGTGNELANDLTGNDANNDLFGADGDDSLKGEIGNDRLDGGAGADRMEGGAGDDVYFIDDGGDTVVESSDDGDDTVRASITHELAPDIERLVLLGTSAINGTGNGRDNQIVGNAADNQLNGGSGDDTLSGDGGSDRLDGGAGADTLEGGTGDDVYVVDSEDTVVEAAGGGSSDTVEAGISYELAANFENLVLLGSDAIDGKGNELDNQLTGNSADNKLSGGDGDDTLVGGDGNDRLAGGTGADVLEGGAGDDKYIVDDAGDTVVEAAGADTDTVQSSISHELAATVENLKLLGGESIDGTGSDFGNSITGNRADNQIFGGDGADILSGSKGKDRLFGGEDDDILVGGKGRDILVGGTDGDHFVFGSPQEAGRGRACDVIRDFARGLDQIDLRSIDADVDRSGNQRFKFIEGDNFSEEARELRFLDGFVSGDTDGDGRANFQIRVSTDIDLTKDDFIL